MKIRITRDELLTGLQRVQGVVEKRNTMPILSNILLEAKQDGVEIVATDLEIGMRGLYKATVIKTGGVTISARKLFEIIKEFSGLDLHPDTVPNLQMGYLFEYLIRKFNEQANEEAPEDVFDAEGAVDGVVSCDELPEPGDDEDHREAR